MANSDRIILIDADVVSHFVTAGEEMMLKNIFPNNPIHLLDKVHAELQRWPNPQLKMRVSIMLTKKIIRLMDFPNDMEIVREYAWIRSQHFLGEGESACLAVARYHKRILASSNLRDITKYCITHSIDYLTTMDFLCAAKAAGIFDQQRCNAFLQKVLAAGGKLPIKSMDDFTCRVIEFI